jgi:hypothetical protein
MGGVIVLVFFLLYGGLIFALFRWSRNLMNRRAQEVADALAAAGAKIVAVHPSPGLWDAASVELTLDGRPATYRIRRFSRDWFLCSIGVPSAPLPYVLVRRERAADRLGKRLGFNREVQLGDPAFDDAAFIDTVVSDDVVRRLFERAEVREAVIAVLATGYGVDLSPEGVKAFRLIGKLSPIDAPTVPTAVAALERLAPLLPAVDTAQHGKPHWLRSPRAFYVPMFIGLGSFAVVMFLMGMLGASGALHPLADHRQVPYLFAGGFGLWIAAVAALYFFLRGGTRSLGQLVLAAFFLLLGLPALGAMLLGVANSAFDSSPAVTHDTRVIGLPKNPRKSRQVGFEPWQAGLDRVGYSVPASRLSTLKVGDPAQIVTHAGALGWEWIEEVKF